jgi:oxygen-dependent protoporphyrinogen oxidase
MKECHIAVIGAGIAGLSAAYRLQQAGCSVHVFEAQEQVGGRMSVRSDGPITYNTGARLVYPFGKDLHRLIDELQLRSALEPHRNLHAACRAEDGEYRVDLMPGVRALATPGLATADRVRLATSALRLARLRAQVDPDDAMSALAFDDETLSQYITRTAGRTVLKRMVEPIFRGTRCWNPDEISAAFYVSTAPHLLGEDTVYTFSGGMGQLTRALAQRLDVVCNAQVASIERREQGGCVIRYTQDGAARETHADVVVCAVEGARAAGLLHDMDADERRFLGGVRYNSLGIVHYALDMNLPSQLQFAARGLPTRIATWQQLPAAPEAGRPTTQLYCQLTPEAVQEAVTRGVTGDLDSLIRDEVRQRVPGIDKAIISIVNQWIPFKLPIFYPGYARKAQAFRQRQAAAKRDVYFCGDYLSQALVNGACASGVAVANLIAAHHA